MRQRNGYRGVHEFLSGTRVVRLRPAPRPPTARKQLDPQRGVRPVRRPVAELLPVAVPWLERDLDTAQDLPQQIGSFEIRGILPWHVPGRLLLGHDPSLQRNVLIWLRPGEQSPFDASRRRVGRAARLRWLAGGTLGVMQWDALIPPAGRPLTEVLAHEGRRFWPDARPVLEQLTDELIVACREGNLPRTLTADQVWIDSEANVLLLDFPFGILPQRPAPVSGAGNGAAAGDQSLDDLPEVVPARESDRQARDRRRALVLLRHVATMLLEGRARPADEERKPIRAPVPLHANRMLNRLLRVWQKPLKRAGVLFRRPFDDRPILGHEFYRKPEEFQEDLATTQDEPTEVSRGRRLVQIARGEVVIAIGVFLGLGCWGWVWPGEMPVIVALQNTNLWPLCCLAAAFLTRGDYMRIWYARRIVLRRMDGGKPGHFQAAWRSFLYWAPPALLLNLSVVVGYLWPEMPAAAFALWFLVLPLLIAYAVHALLCPNCCLHDRLARTYVVPE
jgi:hypothetical protein